MQVLIAAGWLVGALLIGSIPFAYVTARLLSGADLRRVGTGTVSGTGVLHTSGFWAMAVSGILDIGKGVAAVVFLAEARPLLAAFCAGAAAAGHNWSPFLRGAGGRAISVAAGSCLVLAWPGAVVLGLGLGLGKLCGETGLGSFLAQAALPGALALSAGWPGSVAEPALGAALGLALVVPMWAKRLLGNHPRQRVRPRVCISRLLFDNDEGWPVQAAAGD